MFRIANLLTMDIGRLFASWNKSRRLAPISQKLASPAKGDVAWNSALDELLDLVERDPDLCLVMSQFGADRQTLRSQFYKLSAAGADQWVNSHYVAASALAFTPTLMYVLQNREEHHRGALRAMASRLVSHFRNGGTGLVRSCTVNNGD